MGTQKSISRTERLQLQQQQQQREQQLLAVLTDKKKLTKSFAHLVDYAQNHLLQREQINNKQAVILYDCFDYLRRVPTKRQERAVAFRKLLLELDKKKCHKLLEQEKYVKALSKVACYSHLFLRDLADWRRDTHNLDRMFNSIVDHLLTEYKVPDFMYSAWFHLYRHAEQEWFIELGRGASVRKLDLPTTLNKRMAHEFLQAPAYCSVNEAIRRAQVLALGGCENMAWHVCRSWLVRNEFKHDDFWLTFLQFFAGVPMFDYSRLDEIIDYVKFQKFGRDGLPNTAPQPDFSMKGRTVEALLRRTDEWHQQINRQKILFGTYVWKTCKISGFYLKGGSEDQSYEYFISELLSSRELQDEGKAMHHCVASYDRMCNSGKTAIFSMTFKWSYMPHTQRMLTIEVATHTKTIVQIRGRCNSQPQPREMEMIKKWAEKEGLTVSKWF